MGSMQKFRCCDNPGNNPADQSIVINPRRKREGEREEESRERNLARGIQKKTQKIEKPNFVPRIRRSDSQARFIGRVVHGDIVFER